MRMQMNLNNIISLLGGVALFLFGMTLMGDGLKKVAGSKLELVSFISKFLIHRLFRRKMKERIKIKKS